MKGCETKVPVTTESKPESPVTATQMQMWRPFENLRREVDRLFEGLTLSSFRQPFRRPAFGIEPFWAPESWVAVPAVDFVEKDLPARDNPIGHVKRLRDVRCVRRCRPAQTMCLFARYGSMARAGVAR